MTIRHQTVKPTPTAATVRPSDVSNASNTPVSGPSPKQPTTKASSSASGKATSSAVPETSPAAPSASPSQPAAPTPQLIRWDDFYRPDGRLDQSNGGLLPSGQPWHLDFAGAGNPANLLIHNNQLEYASYGASYLWTVGGTVTGGKVNFLFKPGVTNQAGVGLIFSKLTSNNALGSNGVATNSVHCVFGPATWSCGIFDGSHLTSMGNGTYSLVKDGLTTYSATVTRTAPDQLTVDVPDGTVRVINNTQISQWWGSTVITEHYQPIPSYNTDALPLILGYYVYGY